MITNTVDMELSRFLPDQSFANIIVDGDSHPVGQLGDATDDVGQPAVLL
jgi:hypothetical protein